MIFLLFCVLEKIGLEDATKRLKRLKDKCVVYTAYAVAPEVFPVLIT
jgi:hypothetical protein